MSSKNIILLLGHENSYYKIIRELIGKQENGSNYYQVTINEIEYDLYVTFGQSKSINPFSLIQSIECISNNLKEAENIYAFGICGSCNGEKFPKQHIVFPSQFGILSKQELIENSENPMNSATKLTNELVQELQKTEHVIPFGNQFIQLASSISNSTPNTRNLTVPGILTNQHSLNGIDEEHRNMFLEINDTVEMECYQIVNICKQYKINLGVYLQVSDILIKEDFSFSEEDQEIFKNNFFTIMNQIK